MERSILTQRIKDLADSTGIDIIGFAEAAEFKDYILNNSIRRNPKLSLEDARSIIIVGVYIGGFAIPNWDKHEFGRASRLFLSGFFNDVIEQLKPITDLLQKEGYKAIICNDNENGESVLPLKLSAIRAGFGWQGKNSLLINKKYGSFLALGGIITDAGLDYNTQEEINRCVNCNKCRQACPVNALGEEYVLNKDKCLSFRLQRDNFPKEAESLIGNRVIDCEICQEICPWNYKHIKEPLNTKLTESFKNEIAGWEDFFSIAHLRNLTETDYKAKLGYLNTEVPFELFRRNIIIVLENIKHSKQSG